MAVSGAHSDDDHPLVSVVMPVYNSQEYLAEAIESVLGQTYVHWELLLVDDGSTDASLAIETEYATLHRDRVRILRHPGHRGLPASRNLGIANARGEFVAGLDSDDVWLPERIQHQVQLMLDHPEVGMVCGPSWYWFSWAGSDVGNDLDFRRELKIEYDQCYNPPELLRRLLLAEIHPPTTGASLIRRSLLVEVGGYVEEFPAMYEDQVMLAKILFHAPVYASGEALDRYRQHDSSITARAGSALADIHVPLNPERRAFLEWVASYLKAVGNTDPELSRVLDAALAPYDKLWLYRLTHPGELARWVASKALPTSWQRALWRRLRRRRQRADGR